MYEKEHILNNYYFFRLYFLKYFFVKNKYNFNNLNNFDNFINFYDFYIFRCEASLLVGVSLLL